MEVKDMLNVTWRLFMRCCKGQFNPFHMPYCYSYPTIFLFFLISKHDRNPPLGNPFIEKCIIVRPTLLPHSFRCWLGRSVAYFPSYKHSPMKNHTHCTGLLSVVSVESASMLICRVSLYLIICSCSRPSRKIWTRQNLLVLNQSWGASAVDFRMAVCNPEILSNKPLLDLVKAIYLQVACRNLTKGVIMCALENRHVLDVLEQWMQSG